MYSNDLNLWVLLESEFWTSILSVQRDYACCALPNIFWSLNQIFAGNRVFESTFSSITDFLISWKHQISQLWRQSWTKLLCWSIQYSWSHFLANGQYNKMDTKNIILSAEIRISSFGQSSRINTMSFDHSKNFGESEYWRTEFMSLLNVLHVKHANKYIIRFKIAFSKPATDQSLSNPLRPRYFASSSQFLNAFEDFSKYLCVYWKWFSDLRCRVITSTNRR